MKQCVKGIGASHLRRLQVKWKADGDRLKEEAQGRIRASDKVREKAQRATSDFGFPGSSYAAALAVATGMSRHDALAASSTVQSMLATSKLMEAQFGAGGLAGLVARDAAMRETYSKMMGPSGLLGTMQHSAAAAAILEMTLPSSAASEFAKSLGVLD